MERYEDFDAVTRYALRAALAEERVEVTSAQEDELVAAFGSLPLYPDVEDALARLAELGHDLAVLSNGTPAMLAALLASTGLGDRFRAVVSVDEVGVYKPAPAVYRHAAARLGCAPAELWLVSGNGWDAAGAKSAGLRAATVERSPGARYPFAEPPDVVVSSLAELPSALAAWS